MGFSIKGVTVTGSARGYTPASALAPLNWTYRTGLSSTTWGATRTGNYVCWNGSYYLVGGTSRGLATSTDGITWTYRTGLTGAGWDSTATVNKIIWDGSKFLAVGGWSGNGRLATSTDAVTWTNNTSYAGLGAGTLSSNTSFSISTNGTIYVAGGGVSRLGYSTDGGSTWTNSTELSGDTDWGAGSNVQDIIWNGSIFLAVGQNGRVATSSNGTDWTVRTQIRSTTFGTATINRATWNGTQFLVGGGVGGGGRIATSTDGITWTYRSGLIDAGWNTANDIRDIVWANSRYVAVGGAGQVGISTDGITWILDTGLAATTWGANTAFALGTNGTGYVALGATGRAATATV